MDKQQLAHEYEQFCRGHVNPPSFETWLEQLVQYRKEMMAAFGVQYHFEKGKNDDR